MPCSRGVWSKGSGPGESGPGVWSGGVWSRGLVWRGLVQGGAWSRGSAPGGSAPGGVPDGDPPGRLLLQAVRNLLECILVSIVITIRLQNGLCTRKRNRPPFILLKDMVSFG